MRRAIVAVTNDLVTDQRVRKVCLLLQETGFDVLLVGRRLPESPPMDERPYPWKRMRLLFRKGPLFYAEYNIRLFFFLLVRRASLLVSNDLDTLPGVYAVSRIRRLPVVYDSHEFFTEVPELQGRSARRVWLWFERRIFPKLKDVITVSDSIAAAYERQYGVKVQVVRNLPSREHLPQVKPLTPAEAGIPEGKRVLILQGSGINKDRGGEEAVLAMRYVEQAVLLVVGSGDALPLMKQLVEEEQLQEKVIFIPRQPLDRLYAYTALAEVGLSLDKDDSLNQLYSLPNKLFDYIYNGVPVLTSNLPEVARIVKEYDVGLVLDEYSEEAMASAINWMLEQDYKKMKKEKLQRAAASLVWEREKDVLKRIYEKYR
jgi:glycosyltransferase involved in cell wall biosynthesis